MSESSALARWKAKKAAAAAAFHLSPRRSPRLAKRRALAPRTAAANTPTPAAEVPPTDTDTLEVPQTTTDTCKVPKTAKDACEVPQTASDACEVPQMATDAGEVMQTPCEVPQMATDASEVLQTTCEVPQMDTDACESAIGPDEAVVAPTEPPESARVAAGAAHVRSQWGSGGSAAVPCVAATPVAPERRRARWDAPGTPEAHSAAAAVPMVPSTPLPSAHNSPEAPSGAERELNVLKARFAALEAELGATKAALAGAQREIAQLRAAARARPSVSSPARTSQLAQLSALQQQHAKMQAHELQAHELAAKPDANVRVLCRVRPALSADEAAPLDNTHRVLTKATAVAVAQRHESHVGGDAAVRQWRFKFDRVLGPGASQRDVYADVRPLVRAAFDGMSVCVFAYGQTNAGKTYSMLGAGGGEREGIMPRAIDDLFAWAEAAAAREQVTLQLRASALEVYCDQVFDLLTGGGAGQQQALPVRQAADGRVVVAGLTWRGVATRRELRALLAASAAARHESATELNARSSRSHTVVQVELAGSDGRRGALALVDLAGSERVARSRVAGAALKEAQAINASLATLGDVVNGLATGAKHVRFRDNKLTRLLEPHLTRAGARALLLVNVSPAPRDATETVSSLRFANKVRTLKQ